MHCRNSEQLYKLPTWYSLILLSTTTTTTVLYTIFNGNKDLVRPVAAVYPALSCPLSSVGSGAVSSATSAGGSSSSASGIRASVRITCRRGIRLSWHGTTINTVPLSHRRTIYRYRVDRARTVHTVPHSLLPFERQTPLGRRNCKRIAAAPASAWLPRSHIQRRWHCCRIPWPHWLHHVPLPEVECPLAPPAAVAAAARMPQPRHSPCSQGWACDPPERQPQHRTVHIR